MNYYHCKCCGHVTDEEPRLDLWGARVCEACQNTNCFFSREED